MSLNSPMKFSDGYRVHNADCYGDVYLYPAGHWLLQTHLRIAGGARTGTSIHVSFILCDDSGIPLQYQDGPNGIARFGMPAGHRWSVDPHFLPGPSERHDETSGELPVELLDKMRKVALIFTHVDNPPNLENLLETAKQIAKVGAAIAAVA